MSVESCIEKFQFKAEKEEELNAVIEKRVLGGGYLVFWDKFSMFFTEGIHLQNSKITTVTMARLRIKFKTMIFMYFLLKTFLTKTGKSSIRLTIKTSIVCIKI